MKEDAIKSALLDIEDTIRSSPFESWRKDYVRRNLGEFTFDDENKLIYTTIHQEFEAGVEARILESLPAGFDYEDFQRSLPGYIDGPGKGDEATGKAITMLIEVGDFEQFKTMMMFYRREQEEEEGKHSGDQLTGIATNSMDVAQISDVDGMMDMVRVCVCVCVTSTGSFFTNHFLLVSSVISLLHFHLVTVRPTRMCCGQGRMDQLSDD